MCACRKLVCLKDYEQEAKRRLNRSDWKYYSYGAGEGQTLRDNVDAFMRYRIKPSVLHDVSHVDTSCTLLGQKIDFPFGIAPSGLHCLAHHEGETATARAALDVGTCMILSMWSSKSIEEVGVANGKGMRWCLLQIFKDKVFTEQYIRKAEGAGYGAIVLCVDEIELDTVPNKVRDFILPAHVKPANFPGFISQFVNSMKISATETWDSLDWLRSVTSLPIIIKGILTAEDAKMAVQHDVQGIIVSNHGGRQLDGVPATLDALSEVVEAVDGHVEVYLDGGVRKGTDIIKAIALGAKAVFIGRPVLWGLACNGEQGVKDVLQILKEEFRQALVLSGCRSVADISRNMVVHKTYYTHPTASSKL